MAFGVSCVRCLTGRSHRENKNRTHQEVFHVRAPTCLSRGTRSAMPHDLSENVPSVPHFPRFPESNSSLQIRTVALVPVFAKIAEPLC